MPNTGLENFEGLNAYKKLVRKELLNTVRTNRVDLDTLVSAICHLAMCACQLQDFPCLIACVRMGSIGRRLKFEGGMIEKYSTVMYKDAAPVRTPTSICACSHSQHTAPPCRSVPSNRSQLRLLMTGDLLTTPFLCSCRPGRQRLFDVPRYREALEGHGGEDEFHTTQYRDGHSNGFRHHAPYNVRAFRGGVPSSCGVE